MIRIWHIVLFAGVLLIAAAAMAPARLFLHPRSGEITYRDVEGTIWNPTLVEARLGRLNAGNVRLAVSPVDLLFGRLATDVTVNGPDLQGAGRFEVGLGGELRVLARNLVINGAPLGPVGGLPGSTHLEGVEILFADRACRSARGHLESDALALAAGVLGHNGPTLAGGVSCQGAVARLLLAGERDNDQVTALLDLGNDGTGTWSVTYATDKPELAATLIAAGLPPETKAGVFTSRGTVRWLPF
jgi:hypothetical protein